MGHKLFKTFALGTTLVAAGAAAVFYKHRIDSQKAIELVTEELGTDKEIVSSWTEPLYQRVEIDGAYKYCIVGGINIMEEFTIAQYHFLVDAFTGEILDLKKTN